MRPLVPSDHGDWSGVRRQQRGLAAAVGAAAGRQPTRSHARLGGVHRPLHGTRSRPHGRRRVRVRLVRRPAVRGRGQPQQHRARRAPVRHGGLLDRPRAAPVRATWPKEWSCSRGSRSSNCSSTGSRSASCRATPTAGGSWRSSASAAKACRSATWRSPACGRTTSASPSPPRIGSNGATNSPATWL